MRLSRPCRRPQTSCQQRHRHRPAIRRNHLAAVLVFSSVLGEPLPSVSGPSLCDVSLSSRLPLETYRELGTSYFARYNRALYQRTARRDRLATRPKKTTVPAHMDIHPFTESQTSAVLLTRFTRWSDAHRLECQEEPPRTRHRLNTPAGELR